MSDFFGGVIVGLFTGGLVAFQAFSAITSKVATSILREEENAVHKIIF